EAVLGPPLRGGRFSRPALRAGTLLRAGVSLLLALSGVARLEAQRLLVPMDDGQQNHLKAYGLTYRALKAGMKAEWLLNYRGGAFLLPDTPELRRQSGLDGITAQSIDEGQLSAIRAEIAAANMDAIPL